MAAQIPLKLEQALRYSSASFVLHAGVNSVVHAVMTISRKKIFSSIYIQGAPATGKTHLGVYLVGAVRQEGRSARMISGAELSDWLGSVLPHEPLLPGELVILDDADSHLESASAKKEEGLFVDLVERVSAVSGILVLLGQKHPESLRCSQQARSRLAAGMVLSLGDPAEESLDTILDSVAKQRGLALSEAKRGYLLRRVGRTVSGLVECVARVEEGALDSVSTSTSFEVLSEAVAYGRPKL
jgi:DnaA family protein